MAPLGAMHPLSTFLRDTFPGGKVFDLAELNREASRRGLQSGGGAALRFVAPSAMSCSYEERVFASGEVVTRADNFHDFFNALIWLAFPRSKQALNQRHADTLRAGSEGCRRGALRDAMTQFDECGVVVAGMPADLQRALRSHSWREVFVERRAELISTTRFLVFGHGSHDALRTPYPGLCGKALFLDVPCDKPLEEIDQGLARRIAIADFSPRDWQPLPLLGIPGATPDNEDPIYYDDTRQFRPARTIAAGSSLGNR